MGCSTLHIKTELECRVFLFDEEKGIAKSGVYFNLQVHKGEQDLLFVSTEDENLRCSMFFNVEENDCDYRLIIEKSQFVQYSQDFLNNHKLAEQGDAKAQFNLGKYYSKGDGAEMDYKKAVEWYTKAAEQGYSRAQNNLGFLYNKGQGVAQDYQKAFEWFRKAAKQGDAKAQANLGLCYIKGEGIEQNYPKAIEWFHKAAEQGDAKAQANLGLCYIDGEGVEQDYRKAIKWFRKAAEAEYVDAQYGLGVCYENGWGAEQDYIEAVKWYRKAAEQGNAKAQFNLGLYYKETPQSDLKAMEWFTKSAEQGYAAAQRELGSFYEEGLAVKQDYQKAVEWYTKAAEQGDARAQCYLGNCYDSGNGVEQNFHKAAELFTKSGRQGFARAQFFLGGCYEYGMGVEKDWQKALEWYRKAAEQGLYEYDGEIPLKRLEFRLGDAIEQFKLGHFYEFGEADFKQNYPKAVEWYTKSAEQGNADAKESLKRIERKLKSAKTQNNNTKTPYYLFFDTETTGVPKNYKAPASDTDNWPRLVQLGWILTDEDGNTLHQGNEIVRPDGFTIPSDAANVHGITTEKAMRVGKPLRNVIENFLSDVKQSYCLVGHNISFDQHVVGAELYRLELKDIVSNKRNICTMQSTIDYCKIPGYYGYKYPKLQELYNKLFGCNFEDAHDAMADITATKKCFFELERLGVI